MRGSLSVGTGTDWVRITLNEVHDFPDTTSDFGGYDVDGEVAIRCGACSVHDSLWFSTGEVWDFYSALREAYEALAGEALFRSSEGAPPSMEK